MSDVEEVNQKFDSVLAGKFKNPEIILQTVQSILLGYGVNLPNIETDGIDDEFVFNVESIDGNDAMYLYIAVDQDDTGMFEGYAQIIDGEDLEDLEEMDDDIEDEDDDKDDESYLRQTRRSSDS
jgi:hypothetical protein